MSKTAKTAITPTRKENFPEWYQNVIKASDMAENAPVRGCMTIKPYGFAVWENIQRILDKKIKDIGVQNAYFPLLIPLEYITKEAEHVDGFATECAIVTHHRLEKNDKGELVPAGELQQPYVIRPTSETIIGEAMSRWVKSYRDLPLKLNQWANVMRWEMRPRMFLRTAEFLWQEGHNAFATEEEAKQDAKKMINLYRDFFENIMAIPVIAGEKTEDEKFPGAVSTLTIEAMMQDGKALQAGTSHYLGQTFSKSSGILYQGKDGNEHYAHTTSWGVSTRMIGGMIMSHGDDDGMIMPPRIAPYQIVIIPIIRQESDKEKIMSYISDISSKLINAGISCHIDDKEERVPNKMWDAIKKGVPIRVEIGLREADEKNLTHVRRDIGRDSKETCSAEEFINKAESILDAIHDNMFNTAKERMENRVIELSNLEKIKEFFASTNQGFVKMPIELLDDEKFTEIRKEFMVTPRCKPFSDERKKVIIGKSY